MKAFIFISDSFFNLRSAGKKALQGQDQKVGSGLNYS
jgi:hypothetical protein